VTQNKIFSDDDLQTAHDSAVFAACFLLVFCFCVKIGTLMIVVGHGAMAAHQTLDLWILVRLQVPQLYQENALLGVFSCL
jgi:hypothetical protein